MNLRSIITSEAEASTLGDVEKWLEELGCYGLSRDTELLDGAQLHPADTPSLLAYVGYPNLTNQITLEDLAAWVTHLYANGATPETALLDAEDLAADLTLDKASATPINCGVIGCDLLNVVVDIHAHDDAVPPVAAQFGTILDLTLDLAASCRPYFTVTAAANALGVSRGMVKEYLREGLLEDSPIGDTHRIPAASLESLVAQRIAADEEAVRLVQEEPNNPRVLDARQKAKQVIANRDEN